MTRQSAACYKAVFKYVESIFELKPYLIITDFEKALRKSIKDVYPDVRLKGCWFHYCSAIRRKCYEFGLRSLVFYNPEARFSHRKLLNLPLLPPNEIVRAFDSIKRAIQQGPFAEKFKKLLAYFESYWLVQVSIGQDF